MDWLEQKYLGLVSNRLTGFKRKSGNTFNFRCPICGDSQKSKTKARGWIYEKQGKSLFFCHNCNASMTLPNFIKFLDPNLYTEFKIEKLGAPQNKASMVAHRSISTPVFQKTDPLSRLQKVSSLHVEDPIKKYVVSRRIPAKYHYKLFKSERFFEFVNAVLPGKFDDAVLKRDEPRLVIPFLYKDKVHAFQGRSLDPASKTKYVTIVVDESIPKVYGLDTVDFKQRVYVFEGPIDSMFVTNSVATAGGDLVSLSRGLDKKNLVIVYDNEPRSVHTVKKMKKAIDAGYSICIWPDGLEQKDVNDMVLSGLKPQSVENMIEEYTFSGLRATVEFSRWKRVSDLKIKNFFTRA